MLTIEQLLDKAEITEVLYRYAHGVDRRDYEMLRSCYHEDGYDDHGPYKGDADGLVKWITERHETIEHSMHCIGNVLIELDGDAAQVESYCITFQRLRAGTASMPAGFEWAAGIPEDQGSVTYSTAVRYVDEFARRDGVWRIGHRTVVFEWKRAGVRDETSLLGADFALATRDRTDPYYVRASHDREGRS
jgi:hypothetical protein